MYKYSNNYKNYILKGFLYKCFQVKSTSSIETAVKMLEFLFQSCKIQ